jgi:outer membrane lipoprotein LolB
VRHADQSDSAAVQWQQDGNHFDIFLSGPLGAGATRLTGTPDKLVIQGATEQHTTAADPQQIIEQQLGWTLPLDQLPRWILGCSDNGHAQFNADNTLAGFTRDGWQVSYAHYQPVGPWLLPGKIVLKHEDMQVTIVIKHWELQ